MRTTHRVFITLAVVALSLWAIYPPADRIALGLDLQGGVHLVLRVDTDDALMVKTQAAVEQLRVALSDRGIPITRLDATAPGRFVLEGAADGPAFRSALAEAAADFDRSIAGGLQTFQLKSSVASQVRLDTVQQARETIERRVNELGVAEAMVARYGSGDRIAVQLPGLSDVKRAKQILKATAQLRLTLVEQGPFPSHAAAMLAYGDGLPADLEILPGRPGDGTGDPVFYAVRRTAAVSGTDVRNAQQSVDEFNRPAVAFTLEPAAAARFGEFTSQHVNRVLATVLDGRVTSVATIESRIDGHGQIRGVTHDDMVAQVINLNSGALPADLEYVEERAVSATLGGASIRAGVLASAGGLALVMLFMVAYYRLTGLNALISIVLNLLILVALMAVIPVTMTLPGIAGLILTIGMGVDSNVLIFERIKEELATSGSVRAAVNGGFNRVWLTIVDTHVTSLVAAAFLFQFGTIPIRGFALTLTIGLIANVFTAVFVSRTLFELMLARRRGPAQTLSIVSPLRLFANTQVDFSRWHRLAVPLSVFVIGGGMATVATRGLPLGIDFSGGTAFVVEFGEEGVTEDAVRAAVAAIPGDEVVQRFGPAADRQFLIRLPLVEDARAGDSLEAGALQVTRALEAATLPDFTVVKRDLVSAVIGEDLQWRGIYAAAASIAAITVYIAARFRVSFAIGGIAATLHDVQVTLACLSLAGYDLSLNVTAALLTIVGYSVNDTIVIFDRVRENLREMRRAPLDVVVNRSVNQTLSRTVITAGTTFLSVLALYLFGGEALEGFAFTMMVGIVSGTYSTIFIASAIATGGRSTTPAAAR